MRRLPCATARSSSRRTHPAWRSLRVPVLAHQGRGWSSHCEVQYSSVRVPAENLLGTRGDGFMLAEAPLDRADPPREALAQTDAARVRLMCIRARSKREALPS